MKEYSDEELHSMNDDELCRVVDETAFALLLKVIARGSDGVDSFYSDTGDEIPMVNTLFHLLEEYLTDDGKKLYYDALDEILNEGSGLPPIESVYRQIGWK